MYILWFSVVCKVSISVSVHCQIPVFYWHAEIRIYLFEVKRKCTWHWSSGFKYCTWKFLSTRKIPSHSIPTKWRSRNKPQRDLLEGKRLANNSHRNLPAKKTMEGGIGKSYIHGPGTVALREIHKLQRTTHFLLGKKPFVLLVRQIAQNALAPRSIAPVSGVSSLKQSKRYKLRARISSRN